MVKIAHGGSASKGVVISPGWWCWLEVPVVTPGWSASPVFVESVQPLKTGVGALRVTFIEAIHPIAAQRRDVVLRVAYRGQSHIVGTLQDADGAIRTAVLTAPDFSWLATFCPLLLQRRPPVTPSWHVVSEPPPPGPTPSEYLEATFGREPSQILRGAAANSFGLDRRPMPDRSSHFVLDETYNAFDSWMIARGSVPTEMEEKWFVYMEAGRLVFRRSWTGNLIYDVEARWRGDQLCLGDVRVNRDPEQYSETDDVYDRRMLRYLIAVVLLGKYNEPSPVQDDSRAENAPLQAWSTAGKASLPPPKA